MKARGTLTLNGQEWKVEIIQEGCHIDPLMDEIVFPYRVCVRTSLDGVFKMGREKHKKSIADAVYSVMKHFH